MIELNQEKAKLFLAQNNLQNSEIKKIAGDASMRSYYRIFSEGKEFILMFKEKNFGKSIFESFGALNFFYLCLSTF